MNRDRFSGVFNASRWPVTLIGLGGIGSNLAITLGKMGFSPLYLVDGDAVSEENCGTQLYIPDEVHWAKTQAMYYRLKHFAPDIEAYERCFYVDEHTEYELIAAPIIISAVDSIAARKQIWDAIADYDWMLYLDVRMGLETAQVWAVTQDMFGNYDAAIQAQDDSFIPDLPCTSKATFYGGALAASCAAYVLRRFITSKPLELVYSFDLGSWAAITI